MRRQRVYDTFMTAGNDTEMALLECRLTELYDAIDGFVIIEAEMDHQGHPKPLGYTPERFERWADKITYVVAELPSVDDEPDHWEREQFQREWARVGLERFGIDGDDIVLHGDLDEIPRAICARNVRPYGKEYVAFQMRGHFHAIDWLYPPGWSGTVAARYETIFSFRHMRDRRNRATQLPDAGWHFSWLGGPQVAVTKANQFAHAEVAQRVEADPLRWWREGIHVDGIKMAAVDVNTSWPAWMLVRANVPECWYRPRG